MQHTELLHRFFDEGVDEPLEDVLFGQMALDPELRREFVAHLKLHSIIQEDVAGITTPSHVSQQLFTTLGLTPPVIPPPAGAMQRLRRSAGAALLLMKTATIEYRRYVYTAVISAVATAVLFFTVFAPGESSETTVENGSRISTSGDVAQSTSPAVLRDNTPAEAVSISTTSIPAKKAVAASASQTPASASQTPASATRTPSSGDAMTAVSSLPAPITLAAMPAEMQPEERAEALRLDGAEVQIAEVPGIDPPWLFSQPGPRTNILSNLVVELRKYYGTSYPDIDLQHNSHKVFENMAISVVHKATEHHAFGFEYGRENFGREFQREVAPQNTPLVVDQSYEQIYTPPAQWVTGPQRENRMLDLFGAVWKLSLPEYGIFDVVYPYMRTFVGATKLGPLGKVRAGLEMYPSNFSSLSVGVEGGMLRYTVDDMSYYTTKLNFTFGVAVGL